ncbi:hypothetical protein GCM10027521_03390 [Amycolatopsis cihanbeyliensis]
MLIGRRASVQIRVEVPDHMAFYMNPYDTRKPQLRVHAKGAAGAETSPAGAPASKAMHPPGWQPQTPTRLLPHRPVRPGQQRLLPAQTSLGEEAQRRSDRLRPTRCDVLFAMLRNKPYYRHP